MLVNEHLNNATKRQINILFLGGAKRVSMGEKFIAAGERLGVEVKLFSYELTEMVPIAAIASIIIGKKWGDADVIDDLHRNIAELGIDILIPFVDGAVEIAARCRDRYKNVWVPVGDADGVAAMFDKITADRIFREANLPVPANNRFPMIAKPRFGSASKGIRILQSESELANLPNKSDYLLQEYIANRKEITTDCYVSLNGEFITAVSRYRIETQGGEASVTETFRDEDVQQLAKDTLARTGLRGAVTIQMLRDCADGRLMLMEINPRLGGGAVCACHAGAQLPEFILRDYLNLQLTPCNDWQSGTRVCRYFAEVCFHTTK
jgi:carbamoyl-phosphate synthase large subunit